MGGHFGTTIHVKLCEKNSGCCVNDHLVQICLPIKEEKEGEEELWKIVSQWGGGQTERLQVEMIANLCT